ncbi:hypothetical protein BD769DRAFT_1639593 [Suillus cothurnatus]|nr:hypothetical protein BD769DRAFT_1639593 [Suillus cothurnatus]
MATQYIDSTHLRQYFEHLAGNTCFMDALQTTSDVDKKLLAFGDDPGLANTVVHLRLLATKNDGLVPGSLKEALRVYFIQCHKKKNAAHSEKRTIVVIHDRFDDTGFKRGTLLVDCGNEDLVGSGNTSLSVSVDESCVIDEAVNDCKGVRPTHGEDLIQFGWNAGPQHAHVFGLRLSMTARQQKDSHALGILALSWNLLVTSLPAKAINEAGLPSMTVKGNNLDSGYTLDLPDGFLCFLTAE